jgi:hypothetical protein
VATGTDLVNKAAQGLPIDVVQCALDLEFAPAGCWTSLAVSFLVLDGVIRQLDDSWEEWAYIYTLINLV